MSDFLLEIFSEEIPAKMQKAAAENLTKIAVEVLIKNGLAFEDSAIKSFATPKRLALQISELTQSQKVSEVKKIGPKINADPRAIEGFLKSVKLSNKAELQQIENNGQACYLYIQPASEVKTSLILKNSLPQILQKMTNFWPKLMRWDTSPTQQPQWIRPIRNIACLFNDEIIELEFAGLKSNNLTFGHFLFSRKPLEIKDAKDYQKILLENFVLVDPQKRHEKILEQIRQIQAELGLALVDNEKKSTLFDEVVGLCEWPTALVGSIDQKFMNLPEEALVLTLKLNQKYFCLKSRNEILAPKFIFITNAILHSENQIKIISDNEKLVKARLSDVEFFIAEDLKKPLISRAEQLKQLVFHQKLGSLHDKVFRLKSLAKFLAIFVPHCDLAMVEKAADLCKADLLTKTVAEMPELQGKIGSFYSSQQGENQKITVAIYEHYLPYGPDSELPQTALGVVLSIADKIDSIVSFFLVGEKPTSSKDPFALRRSTLGIIRIIFQHNLAIPVRILIEKSLNAFPNKLLKGLLCKQDRNLDQKKKLLVEEIIKFFAERLKFYLKENEIMRTDIINAVIEEYLSNLNKHKYCDILYLTKKIRFLDLFISSEQHRNILQLYKRTSNILSIEEKKDGREFNGKPHFLGLKNKYEILLYRRIKQISAPFKKLVAKGEFESAFKLFDVIELPLEQFFEHLMINDENEKIRENRLLILAKIRSLFERVANLSKIEIA